MQKVQQRPTSAFVNIAGNACAAIVFVICVCHAQRAIDVIATHRDSAKGACVDSESRTLATKKFSWLRHKRRVSARQNRIFGRIAGNRFAGVFRFRRSIAAAIDARRVLASVDRGDEDDVSITSREAKFRCRAWTSRDRSRPAGWPCRRMTSSPGRRTSRRVAASPSPARPCQDWPR